MELSNAEKIQIVINTLESLVLPARCETVDKLTGIYHLLAEVRDSLAAPEEAEDGNAEAE